MNGTLTIHLATKTDIPAVEQVLRDGKASIAKLGIAQWQSDGYPSRAEVSHDVEKDACYLAEDETGTALGTIALLFDGEPMYDRIDGTWLTSSTSSAPRYGTLHRTAVSRDAARKGVMSALFAEAERIARERGFESLRADTHPGNTPMRHLLERLGYTECGIVMLERDEPEPERVAYEKLLAN